MRTGRFAQLKALFAPADEQLMWRVQMTGDPGAFGELVRRWEPPLLRLCTRLTGDTHRAEDLVQEIFARVFSQRQRYRPDGRFSTWLWRLALNHTYSALRQPHLHHEVRWEPSGDDEPSPPGAELPDPGPAPDAAALRRETDEAVHRAVQALPETLRAILILRHFEGLKFREIAEILELPEGTVKTRLTEALSLLARRLTRTLGLPAAPAEGRRARSPRLSTP